MSRFFAGFVLGALGGAAVAYLIMNQGPATDLYDRGKRFVDTARSNINDAVEEGQSSAERIRSDLSPPPDA